MRGTRAMRSIDENFPPPSEMRRKRESASRTQFKMPKFFYEVFPYHHSLKTRADILLTQRRESFERKESERERNVTTSGTFSCKVCVYIYKYGSALLRERALSCLSPSLFPSREAKVFCFELSLLYSSSSLFLTARSFRRRLEEKKGSPIYPQPRKGALKCRLRCL